MHRLKTTSLPTELRKVARRLMLRLKNDDKISEICIFLRNRFHKLLEGLSLIHI